MACVAGHEMMGQSKMWNYIIVGLANTATAATVLGGHQPPVYGHRSKGPRAPSLAPLKQHGVDTLAVDTMVDYVLGIHSEAPPQLKVGGSLRELAYAAMAVSPDI